MTEQEHDEQLSPPSKCDACGFRAIKCASNRSIHGARCVDPDAVVYHCPRCSACVGVHAGTVAPLGYMADRYTRQLRARAHGEFDILWRSGRMSRPAAYRLLASTLGIGTAVHIGMLSKQHLLATIEFARNYSSEQAQVQRRREAKKNERSTKRHERDIALKQYRRMAARQLRNKRRGGFSNYGDD